MFLELAATGAAAFAVAAAAVGYLSRSLRRRGKFDLPNQRSAHKTPTPRGGGVGLAAGVAAGLAVAGFFFQLAVPGWAILGGAAALVAVGARDDWAHPLSVRIRLLAQAAVAAGVVAVAGPVDTLPLPSPLDLELGPVGYLLGVVWIVGVTNIYNFLDGIDGYAGAQAVVAAAALLLFAYDPAFLTTGAALAGAAIAFLLYNWRPASIFMGDSGSTSVGFLVAAMPFQAAAPVRAEATFVIALALWFFLADGAYTLLARAFNGEKFWMPHNRHLYQRVARTGLDHNEVVMRVSLGALLLVLAAFFYAENAGGVFAWPPLLIACGAFTAMWAWTRAREARTEVGMTGSAGVRS